MAKSNTKYSFKSVGLSVDEAYEIGRSTPRHAIPFSIKTPIKLSKGSESTFQMYSTAEQIEAIKDNLANLIATNHGARLLKGNFGANLNEIIPLIGTAEGDTRAMEKIKTAVSIYMPFIVLTGYEPIKKISKEGSIDRLAIILTFEVPAATDSQISLEINLYEAK